MKSLAFITILFLQAGPTGTAVITGRILGLDGRPAAGVRVALTSPDVDGRITADTLVAITTADAIGNYRVENVPPGRYGLIAGAVSYPTFYPGVASGSQATIVTVAPGATMSELSFTMVTARKAGVRTVPAQPPLPTGRVFGRVVVEGNPASTNGVPVPPDMSRVWEIKRRTTRPICRTAEPYDGAGQQPEYQTKGRKFQHDGRTE